MIKELNDLLKTGKIKEVQSQLEALEVKKVERSQAFGLANLARRVGFNYLAFRILDPLIKPPDGLKIKPPSAAELVEYGIILFRLGVVTEAQRILTSPEVSERPERSLYLAFICFSEWDYAKAAALLEEYLQSRDLSEYDRLVGQINLAQAYVEAKPEVALPLLESTLAAAKENNYKVVHANSLQIYAEALITNNRLKEARDTLQEIERVLGSDHFRYNLYLKKAWAMISIKENGSNLTEGLNSLKEISQFAKEKRNCELARECAFQFSLLTRDEELLKHIYFGTPHQAFRQRMMRLWGRSVDFGEFYHWNLNPVSEVTPLESFSVDEGFIGIKGSGIKKGTSGHRLLLILASDFYKTFKAEELFSLLFPDQHFHLETSRHRIHETISRTRNWLKAKGINLVINESQGAYVLSSEVQFKVKVLKDLRIKADVLSTNMAELLRVVGDNVFTSYDVCNILKVPTSTTRRYLRVALKQKMVVKMGQGRSTKYRKSSVE